MHHTGIDTVGGTVTGRVHDRGDEVDIGTVITKKVIVRGEKFSKGEIVCLVLSSMLGLYWFIIKLVNHPRLCHGAVASAEVEDSSRIAVSLNSDWRGWIQG